MKEKAINKMIALVQAYQADEEKEKNLGEKIEELKAEQRRIKEDRYKKGTLIKMLGTVKPKKDYYAIRDEQHKIIDEAKEAGTPLPDILRTEEIKAKLKAIEEEGKKLTYTPINKRTWICRHHKGCNGELYVFKIFTRLMGGICEADTDESYYNDFSVSVNERPELKKYKWEIKTRIPDVQSYHGTIETVIKCKDFKEVGEKIGDIFSNIEEEFKKQKADIYSEIGFIFDMNTIQSEIELPFKTGKNVEIVNREN